MWKHTFALGISCLFALSVLAADPEPKKVEVKGALRTGIAAIGGETTGTIIEAKVGTYELDFGKSKELREKADKLANKMVVVTGTQEIRKGIEVKERKIITVATLEEAEGK